MALPLTQAEMLEAVPANVRRQYEAEFGKPGATPAADASPAAEAPPPAESTDGTPPAPPPPATAAQPVAPAAPAAETPAAPVETIETVKAELEKVRHKLSVTAGRLAQRDEEIRTLKQQAKAGTASPTPAAGATTTEAKRLPDVTEAEVRSFIPADQIESYGWEFFKVPLALHKLAMAGKPAAGEYTPPTATAQEASQGDPRRAEFVSLLDALMPDWRVVNEDPRILPLLERPSMVRGFTYRQLLDDAVEDNDASAVVELFTILKTQCNNGGKPAAVTPPGKPSITAQRSPSTQAPGTPAPAKSTITFAEWSKEMDAVAKGFGGRNPAAMAARKKQLDDMEREGRIVG